MALGTYDVVINGIKHTMQFTDDEAERLGLDATVPNVDPAVAELEAATAAKVAADAKAVKDAEDKAAADAAAADAKAVTPANKAAGKPATK